MRDLITEAGVNVAAINYHFGGKEGLRFAAIDHVTTYFREDGPGKAMKSLTPESVAAMSPEEARATLRFVMRTSFERTGLSSGSNKMARYVQRELVQGGKPTELFYKNIFREQLMTMTLLVSRVTGEPAESQITRLRAINLVAQTVFLSLAQPLILMSLDWEEFTAEDLDLIVDSFWLSYDP